VAPLGGVSVVVVVVVVVVGVVVVVEPSALGVVAVPAGGATGVGA
jgi:hypothetical protein